MAEFGEEDSKLTMEREMGSSVQTELWTNNCGWTAR